MLPLICVDVDGTLVGPSHEPTPAVWAAVDRARARGQHVAISTGRGGFGSALQLAERLDPDGWHIFHNGAALVHVRSGEVRADELGEPVADYCADLAERQGWVVEFYVADDYSVESAGDLAVGHARLLGVEHRVRSRDELTGPLVRAQFVVPVEVTDWVLAELRDQPVDVSAATSPGQLGVSFISVTSAGVNKARAIEGLAGLLDISMAEVMMVGDGHNDVEAIAAVGHGVAMGNAVDAVRDVARHEVPPVTEDGLASALDLSATLTA